MERQLNFHAIAGDHISHYLPNGSKLDLSNSHESETMPSDTAFHEARHVVGADFQIIRASNIPEGNSLGHTIPRRMTAAAAAAAEAMGHRGTGHDMRIVDYLGTDRYSAVSAARAKLSGKEAETLEVAREIEKQGTIFQSDVDRALTRASHRKRGIFSVIGHMTSLDGQVTVFEKNTFMNEVAIAVDEMPQAKIA